MILTDFPATQPRVSANQLGEFPFLTASGKLRVLRDQKLGNVHRAPYYHGACCALLHAFEQGRFDPAVIAQMAAEIAAKPVKNDQQKIKTQNNALMLDRFIAIGAAANPPTGTHEVVRRNAAIDLDGVIVSVRPEIITRSPQTGMFSYTKLRFSKSKVSADTSEIILLLLLKYGQHQNYPGLQLDPESTRLIDCFAGTVTPAHMLPRLREQQLQGALREIRRLWPTISPHQ